MNAQIEKVSAGRSVRIIVIIGLIYSGFFVYEIATSLMEVIKFVQEYGWNTILQDSNWFQFFQLTRYCASLAGMIVLLYNFMQLKKWSYLLLLTWVSIVMGVDIVSSIIFPIEERVRLFLSLSLGIIVILTLLQKHIQYLFGVSDEL